MNDSFDMMHDNPMEWDEKRIRFEYDNDWNLTIEQLVLMTGRSREELKAILGESK